MKYEKPEVTVLTFALSAVRSTSTKQPVDSEDSPNLHNSISCYEDNE